MTQQWRAIPPIPRETRRRARAVFSNGNFYLRLGERLPAVLDGLQPQTLIDEAHNVYGPVPVLALVTFFQLVEELSDTQACDALRTRVDWQYALRLPANTPGLRRDELCSYRQILYASEHKRQAFQNLSNRLTAMQPFRGSQAVCEEPVDVLDAVCQLNRLKWTLEAMRHLLWALASRWPDQLSTIALPHWYTTYWADEPLFTPCVCCAQQEEVEALGGRLGADVRYLLDAVARWGQVDVLGTSEIRALERVWSQQFELDARGEVAMRPHCSFCGQNHLVRGEEGL